LKQTPEIEQTREVLTPQDREVLSTKPTMDSLACPYCSSSNFTRRGFRQKTHERVQLYLCNQCLKTFTPHSTASGKHYPLDCIFEGISLYNLGYSLDEACQKLKAGTNLTISTVSLSRWVHEFENLCRFSRMRAYATRRYPPGEAVISATLAHRQLYNFKFHRAKSELIIEENYAHRQFDALHDFLLNVPAECPHQFFQEGLRASEAPLTFSKAQMIVRGKQNFANALATLVLQGVNVRKERHQALEDFMLYNDSVTVATEVPVYLTRDDLLHLRTQLGFQIYLKENKRSDLLEKRVPNTRGERLPSQSEAGQTSQEITAEADIADLTKLPKLITGHIDIIQIRNGMIHILDYKPEAAKQQPIDQLTIYAMALSRLTGLRLYCFKCAWFDEKDYFEFYPLHVLHKPKKMNRRRKIQTQEGTYEINKNPDKIEGFKPNL